MHARTHDTWRSTERARARAQACACPSAVAEEVCSPGGVSDALSIETSSFAFHTSYCRDPYRCGLPNSRGSEGQLRQTPITCQCSQCLFVKTQLYKCSLRPFHSCAKRA